MPTGVEFFLYIIGNSFEFPIYTKALREDAHSREW